MTTNERSREAAYADLVSGLIDARVDVASERFDAELEAAEAAGRLDPATARLLRWWQRESVRAVTEHARTTVPVTLVALETAEREAREAVHRADAAWTTARGVTARSSFTPEPTAVPEPPVSATVSAPPVPAPTVTAPAPTPAAVEPPAATAPQPPAATPNVPAPSAPAMPAAPAMTAAPGATPWSSTLEPPNYPGGPVPASPPARYESAAPAAPAYAPQPAAPQPVTPPPPYPTTPGEAPGIVDLTAREESVDASQSGRRRTLLAGLTVLPRND